MPPSKDLSKPLYQIGAVAHLTGISQHCLRAWERRYGLRPSGRTETRRRLYTQEDVQRLVLIKRLLDADCAISTIAGLSLADLEVRVHEMGHSDAVPQGCDTCRLAVFGVQLAEQIRVHPDHGLNIVALYNRLSEADLNALSADVLVMEYASVYREDLTEISGLLDRTGARRAVVIYRFVHPDVEADLDTDRMMGLQAPIDLHELRLACPETRVRTEASAHALPKRRFNDVDLARIASHSSMIKCECPHHLVNLILSLNAFEDYSARCENRNPEDAQVHAYLHRLTAQARANMEEALVRVTEHEGLE